MKLKDYLKKHGTTGKLAQEVGVTRTWISLVANDHRLASAILAVKIERATKGKVTRKDLRADLYDKKVVVPDGLNEVARSIFVKLIEHPTIDRTVVEGIKHDPEMVGLVLDAFFEKRGEFYFARSLA
jgi:DNA-binding transcriptional regulator YdaS (Cro superfamily)